MYNFLSWLGDLFILIGRFIHSEARKIDSINKRNKGV